MFFPRNHKSLFLEHFMSLEAQSVAPRRKRILVGLMEHIGDIIACEPVARYLRLRDPDAEITWAVSSKFRELIDTNPVVDHTLALDCLTDWMKVSRHGEYDDVVDLHVNLRICQHCKISLVKERGNPFVNVYEWFDYGAILEAFSIGAGLPKLSAHPQLYLLEEHRAAVDALRLPDRYCVVHRESNSLEKDWTDEKWRVVAGVLRDELGLKIVEIGAGKMPPSSPLEPDIDLFNRLPLLQTAEVIRRATLFVGVDSGPAHMANAVGTPGVVLLGQMGFFKKYIPYTGFYASRSPHVKMVRNLTGPARLLPPDEVVEAVRYVIRTAPAVARSSGGVYEGVDESGGGACSAAEIERGPPQDRADAMASGLFDPAWYLLHNPDVSVSGMNPIDHYVKFGSAEGRNPSPAFNERAYRDQNQDVVAAGVNPLLHYARGGVVEGRPRHGTWEGPREEEPGSRAPRPEGAQSLSTALIGETAELRSVPKRAEQMPRTFAFYLPQFHPIPENDAAHGMGFTEWVNVTKAQRLFRGHHQPRVPGELGYYDLRSTEVLEAQLQLANDHGIDGFCFYYYYFQGRKLLHKPLDNYVRSGLKAPFFLLWANENWSKRWDGGDKDIIIAQQHSREDDLAFLRELVPLFRDDRYVKINGKPLLMIYKTHLFPDIVATTDIWREEIEKHGFPGIYLVMVDDWIEVGHPRMHGFDATYEIPSNIVPQQVLETDLDDLELDPDFEGRIVDYRKFAGFHAGRPFPDYKRFRTVMAPWDNTARYGNRAMVHIHGEGDAYRLWLTQALLDTCRRYEGDERIVLLHSWNEWCEGTYLEPDRKFGRFFLEQTRDAIQTVRAAVSLEGDVNTIADLLQAQRMKDEGAFRVMQFFRSQLGYVGGEAERRRQEILTLQARIAALEIGK